MSLVTYAINLNVGRLPGDIFINFILISAAEVPARGISIPLLGCLGRRKAFGFFMLSTGITMLLCIIFLINKGKMVYTLRVPYIMAGAMFLEHSMWSSTNGKKSFKNVEPLKWDNYLCLRALIFVEERACPEIQ